MLNKYFLLLLLVVLPIVLQAQTEHTVTGRIVDTANNPIRYVTILVKNSTIIKTSDSLGRYTITFPKSDSAKLTYNFIGMNTKEVLVENRNIIDITLEDNHNELELSDSWYLWNEHSIELIGGLPYTYAGIQYTFSFTPIWWICRNSNPYSALYDISVLYRSNFNDNHVIKIEIDGSRSNDWGIYSAFNRYDIPEIDMNLNLYKLGVLGKFGKFKTYIGSDVVNFRFMEDRIDWSLQFRESYNFLIPYVMNIDINVGGGYWHNNSLQYFAGINIRYKHFIKGEISCGSWMKDFYLNAQLGYAFWRRRYDIAICYERFLNYEDVSLKLSVKL